MGHASHPSRSSERVRSEAHLLGASLQVEADSQAFCCTCRQLGKCFLMYVEISLPYALEAEALVMLKEPWTPDSLLCMQGGLQRLSSCMWGSA